MEIGTRQLENILEISGQIHQNPSFWQGFHWCWGIFCSQRSILGLFWSSPNHFLTFVYFFLRDLWHPRVLFYDNLSANNFVYCFWIVLCLIAKFWFSFLMIMWKTSDIMTQNQWKSMVFIDFHWFSLILARNIWEATHYRENWKSKVRDEIFKYLETIKKVICEHNITKK